jgi:hypothetical protein
VAVQTRTARWRLENRITRRQLELCGPTLVAAALAITYVIVAPPSLDLAAHLFRAQLFREQGFSIWDNLWYSGHDLLPYSVLFGAASAALTPQLAGAIAAVLTAALFTALARTHLGSRALAGTLLFGAFTAVDLYTGRLDFAFGLAPAMAAVLALDRGHWLVASLLAVLAALCAPLTALFTAFIAAGYGVAAVTATRRPAVVLPAIAVAAGALIPVVAVAVAFSEGGTEPFDLTALIPVLAIAIVGWACAPREMRALRACLAVYAVALVAAYLIASPVGSNVARLGTLLAAPVACAVLWGRRPRLLAAVIAPLLYIGVQAPIRDVAAASGQASTTAAYYRPLLSWLARQGGPPFRIEIPLTALHWESYRVALHVPLARGWERQLDIRDNPIFYRRGALTAASYRTWLQTNAVRFVAVSDAVPDSSARAETALVDRGLPYLALVHRTAHWRVYAVRDATPIAQGPARLIAMGTDGLTLDARRAGTVLLHVHWSPYWALSGGPGCVAPAGPITRVTVRRAGAVRLGMRFALGRIGASSPRCN